MDHDFEHAVQKQLDAAMPWVGLYISAASAVCALAVIVDAVNSFRRKKLWFPCKYSSLNAASLTVLSVAMKLPMDLNTVMIKSETDATAKFMSLFFMSVMVTNFMPSLGSMNDKELFANVVGLGILVITIIGNVGIQYVELRRFLKPEIIRFDIIIPSVLMIVSLVIFVCLAVTVSTMKRNLQRIYQEKHNEMLREEEMAKNVDDQIKHMMKYWMMAESCSPQFVMARSVVCIASSFICCFSFFILILVTKIEGVNDIYSPGGSSYGSYTRCIAYIQFIVMDVGVIGATLRWFRIAMFRSSTISSISFRKEFMVEDYWIQTLKEWRKRFGGLQIRPNRWRKYLHNVKWCVLTLCIGIQILTVVVSKVLVFFSVFIVLPFISFFYKLSKFVRQTEHTSSGDTNENLNLSCYVLLLEGEAELPSSFLRSMCGEADRTIQEGRRQQPSSLLNLLQKSVNFNGVEKYKSNQIPTLLSQDPPDCWTLPVVTLTTMATALPNISQQKCKQLLSSVKEGLSLVNIVEKTLYTNGQLNNIREAAKAIWIEVLLYSKWLGTDLRRAFLNCISAEEVLNELSHKAEKIVLEFKRKRQYRIMENPLNLPTKVIAANSMYRICQTILVSSSGEEMMERISEMIADIVAACLTNMPYAITKMCHQNSMEKRERSVREAFLLLGKTEQVIELVREREPPSLSHDKAAYIEDWRASFQENDGHEADESGGEEHLSITLD